LIKKRWKQKKNEPGSEHKLLNVFTSKWNTEGYTIAGPHGPSHRIVATDIYEWLPGRFFLIHHADAHVGDEQIHILEIIGYNASDKSYYSHSFDNQGNYATSRLSIKEESLKITGVSERFTGRINKEATIITDKWECSDNGLDWQHSMDVKLTKAQ